MSHEDAREHLIVKELWNMATQKVLSLVFILVFYFAPQWRQTNALVYTGICSLMGSLSVMSVKALGTSLKLSFEGKNQLIYMETWFFMFFVVICVVMQMNYLINKALDTFKTAVVSPIYYAMFTSLTIVASFIMFKVRSCRYLSSRIPWILSLNGSKLLREIHYLIKFPYQPDYALQTLNHHQSMKKKMTSHAQRKAA